MISEKRKNRRIEMSRPIVMQSITGCNIPLKCTNFSMDGIGLISNKKIEMGKRIMLTINLANRGKVRLVNLLGQVVYVCIHVDKNLDNSDKSYNIGLRIFDTDIPSVHH